MLLVARMFVLVAGLLALILVLFWSLQRRLIYLPASYVPRPAEVGLANAAEVTFPTEDGLTLEGWFVPAQPPATADTVIVFNGNAGNRAYRADIALALARAGIAVLLFDYRGYGGNPGSPSEQGLAMDARAALRHLLSRPGIDPTRVAYFGESLGSGVAVKLAREQRPRALVLRSPFTSLVDTGRHHYPLLPVRWLLADRFASIDAIAAIDAPLLVIAAAHDSIVPSEQSRRLFDAAREPKRLLILQGTDHNDLELAAGPQTIDAISLLLRELAR
jgi:fermentation-respiration switch protein FrsA (DUF1100 family)